MIRSALLARHASYREFSHLAIKSRQVILITAAVAFPSSLATFAGFTQNGPFCKVANRHDHLNQQYRIQFYLCHILCCIFERVWCEHAGHTGKTKVHGRTRVLHGYANTT